MHCTLCLIQALHGFRLSHLTFRSEQRMQAKAGCIGDVLGEDAGKSMVLIPTNRVENLDMVHECD
jgi:hypothetical protein